VDSKSNKRDTDKSQKALQNRVRQNVNKSRHK